MGNDLFRILFAYTGIVPSDSERAAIESEFMKLRSKFASMVNPHFNKWNDRYVGPADYFDKQGNPNPNSIYSHYILGCQRPFIDKLNKRLRTRNGRISWVYLGIDSDFKAILNDGTKMEMLLKEAI